MNSLLLDSPPLVIQKELAVALGSLSQAMALQQLHFLCGVQEKNNNQYVYRDGHWWVYNSYPQWKKDHFPFWSESKIGRIFRALELKELIISEQLGKHKRDQRKWYRIDYDVFRSIVSKWNDGGCQSDTIMSETTTEKEKREADASPAPEVQSEDLEDPPDPAPFMRKKRQPSERDVLKSVLTAFFSQTTGVPPPQKSSQKECRAAACLWWNPLCSIAAICDNDVERAKKLIEWTVQHMDEKGMTVRTPASIEKIAVGEQARRKRHNGRSGEVREGFTGVTAEQADARWQALKTPVSLDVPPLQPGDGVGARHDMG